MFSAFKLGAVAILNVPEDIEDRFTSKEVPVSISLTDLDGRLEILVPGLDGHQATILFRRSKDFSDIVELDTTIFNSRRGTIKFRAEGSDVTESCISHLISKDVHEELYEFVKKICVDKFGEEASADEYSLVVLDPENPILSTDTDTDDFGKYLLTISKMEERARVNNAIAERNASIKEEQGNAEKDATIIVVDLS